MMISGGITKDGMSKSEVHKGGLCGMMENAKSIQSVQCGKWINSRCAGVKKMKKKSKNCCLQDM